MMTARKVLLPVFAAIVVFVVLYPVICAGGEFEPVNRCQNLFGLRLPGFSYRGGQEFRIYIVPTAGAALAFLATWRWLGRPRETATSRS
jgi:hypothetical protein